MDPDSFFQSGSRIRINFFRADLGSGSALVSKFKCTLSTAFRNKHHSRQKKYLIICRISSPLPVEPESVWERSLALIQVLSILGCIILTLLFVFYPPPSRFIVMFIGTHCTVYNPGVFIFLKIHFPSPFLKNYLFYLLKWKKNCFWIKSIKKGEKKSCDLL